MNRKIFTMIHLLGEHFGFTRTVVRLVDNTRQNVEYSNKIGKIITKIHSTFKFNKVYLYLAFNLLLTVQHSKSNISFNHMKY